MKAGIFQTIGRTVRSGSGAKGRFYPKVLILILISASIPGLITGFGIYGTATKQIEASLLGLHQKQIAARAQAIDEQLSHLEMTMTHWAFEPRFGDNLTEVDFEYWFQETRDIQKTLLVMQGTDPLIRSMMLYIPGPKHVRFRPQYEPVSGETAAAAYDRFLHKDKTMYWTYDTRPEGGTEAADLMLVHMIAGGSPAPFGYLMATLDRDRVAEMLGSLTPYHEGSAFLLDSGRRMMGVPDRIQPETQSLNAVLQEQIAKREAKSDSFKYVWNGTAYSVSYGTMQRIDSEWTYVSAAPITEIVSPVQTASKLILAVSAAGLALALMLSWLVSNRIYLPVGRLAGMLAGERVKERKSGLDEFQLIENEWLHLSRESLTLQTKLKEQLPFVLEGLMLQLMQGYLSAYTEADLRDRLRHLGWEVEDNELYVVRIQLNGPLDWSKRFTEDDEGLVTFAAANIIGELAAELFERYHVVNFHDLSIGLLVSTREEGDGKRRLLELGEQLIHNITRILHMGVKVTVSKPTNSVKRIPYLFEETVQAAGYRDFSSGSQLIDLNEPAPAEASSGYVYPFTLEREIVQQIRMGQADEAEQLIRQFVSELSGNGNKGYVVRHSMYMLVGSIQHMIMQTGIHAGPPLDWAQLYDKLGQAGSQDDMLALLLDKIVRPFLNEMRDVSNLQARRLVEKATQYIEERYWLDLSLESCADSLGTNPFSLSKWFKQVTGINFIDYVTNLRLDKAKEMLRTTDLKINEIAEKVGYQHTYFNRIFKKQVGLTPSHYREASRS